MSGPWERYAPAGAPPAEEAGPWARYRPPATDPSAQPSEQRDTLRRGEAASADGIQRAADAQDYRRSQVNADRQINAPAGVVEQLAGGAKNSWDKAALGLKGMFTDLSDEDRQLLRQGRAFVDETGPASTVGQVAGDIAISAPALALGGAGMAAAGRGAASALPRASAAARALAATLQGNLAGRGMLAAASAAPVIGGNAALGAAMNPEDRRGGAEAGAIGAGAGMALQRVAGGVLKPLMTEDAQALARTGKMVPTPGQALGDLTNSLEQRATSIPLVGDMIGYARRRNLQDFNRDLAVDAARFLPPDVRTAIRKASSQDEALHALRDGTSDLYEAALSPIKALKVDTGAIAQATKDALDDPSLILSTESKQRIADYVQKNLIDRDGLLTGEAAKRIESDLGRAATRLATSAVGEERSMGSALQAVHSAWRDSLTGAAEHVSPGAGKALREADQSYRALLPLDRAAAGGVGPQRGGAATPRMLYKAMAALDKSANDRALRGKLEGAAGKLEAGGATPYDTTVSRVGAGMRTLGESYPDSGTAGRVLLGSAATGGGAFLGALPHVLGAAGVSVALYSKLGSRMLLMGVAPETTAKVLRWAASNGVPEDAALAQMPRMFAAYERATQQPEGNQR